MKELFWEEKGALQANKGVPAMASYSNWNITISENLSKQQNTQETKGSDLQIGSILLSTLVPLYIKGQWNQTFIEGPSRVVWVCVGVNEG